MTKSSQRRAIANNRRRLRDRGMSRYEVRGLDSDKELVRALARRLALGDAAAARLRAELTRQVAGTAARRGGVFAALRRSPLVGAELDVERAITGGRGVEP